MSFAAKIPKADSTRGSGRKQPATNQHTKEYPVPHRQGFSLDLQIQKPSFCFIFEHWTKSGCWRLCPQSLLESLFLPRNSYEHPSLAGSREPTSSKMPPPFTLLFGSTIQGVDIPSMSLKVSAQCTPVGEAAFLADLTLWEYCSQMGCESLSFKKASNSWGES